MQIDLTPVGVSVPSTSAFCAPRRQSHDQGRGQGRGASVSCVDIVGHSANKADVDQLLLFRPPCRQPTAVRNE